MSERDSLRMGELLVREGILTANQVDEILIEQFNSEKPFGVIACEKFGIDEEDIWEAYACQMVLFYDSVDLACEVFDIGVTDTMTAREAWMQRILPMRFDGQEYVCATTREQLPKAMAFVNERFDHYVHFALAERGQLEVFIMQQYAEAGQALEI